MAKRKRTLRVGKYPNTSTPVLFVLLIVLYSMTWKISRYGFFSVAFCASFVWYWFPDFIFTALSYFTFPCWIKPDDRVVNQVFGMTSGMGLLPLTFDCECDRTGLQSLQLILMFYRESNRLCRISIAGAKLGDRQRGCGTGFLDLDSCHCAILL